ARVSYGGLEKPLVKRKWPVRYAPVDRNKSRTALFASACGITNAYYNIGEQRNRSALSSYFLLKGKSYALFQIVASRTLLSRRAGSGCGCPDARQSAKPN